jgi:hypothetical protein
MKADRDESKRIERICCRSPSNCRVNESCKDRVSLCLCKSRLYCSVSTQASRRLVGTRVQHWQHRLGSLLVLASVGQCEEVRDGGGCDECKPLATDRTRAEAAKRDDPMVELDVAGQSATIAVDCAANRMCHSLCRSDRNGGGTGGGVGVGAAVRLATTKART